MSFIRIAAFLIIGASTLTVSYAQSISRGAPSFNFLNNSSSSSPLDPTGSLAIFLNSTEHQRLTSSESAKTEIAKWLLSTQWVKDWVSQSPFSAGYVESAVYLSGVKIGSTSRANEKPAEKEVVEEYFKRKLPQLRPDQRDRIVNLYLAVDRKIVEWRRTLRETKLADTVALEFANAADDARVAQLYQEIILGKSNEREADFFIPKYEKLANDQIDGMEFRK